MSARIATGLPIADLTPEQRAEVDAERSRNAKFLRLSRAVDAAVRLRRDLQLAYADLEKAAAQCTHGETVDETETIQDARAILITRMR